MICTSTESVDSSMLVYAVAAITVASNDVEIKIFHKRFILAHLIILFYIFWFNGNFKTQC